MNFFLLNKFFEIEYLVCQVNRIGIFKTRGFRQQKNWCTYGLANIPYKYRNGTFNQKENVWTK